MGEWRVVSVLEYDPLLLGEAGSDYVCLAVSIADPEGTKWGGKIRLSQELVADPDIDIGAFLLEYARRRCVKMPAM